MKIHRIKAEGFLSLGKVEVNLNRSGVTLIEGFNHDSPAESNGAGKSSLFEALYWGLYGVTRRVGLGADDVINRHYKGPTEVVVAFSKGGSDYVVQRGRGKVGTLAFMLADGKDLTKGTAKDTQALIEETIGLSSVAFAKSVFFGQGDVRPLTEMTDSELKTVFEQGLGLSRVSEDAAKVSAYRKDLEAKLLLKQQDLRTAKLLLDQAKETHEEKTRACGLFDETRAKALSDAENELLAAREQLALLEELTVGLRVKKAELDGRLKVSSENIGELIATDEAFRARLERERIRLNGYAEQVRQYEEQLNRLEKERVKLTESENQPCEYCGHVMDRKAIETSLKGLHERMVGVVDALDKERKLVASADGNVARMSVLGRELSERVTEESRANSKANHALLETSSKLAETIAREAACRADIERLERTLESLKEDTGAALKEELFRATEALHSHIDKIEVFETEVNDLASELEIAEMLAKALGNGGVKSMVLERVIPAVNAYANEYLSALDSSLSVAISATTKLKSGETREKFSLSVVSKSGAKVYAGHSGGEKQKVNLAVSLAFNRLMREAAEVPDLLVLDEPFESLDAGSSEQVVELLAGLSSNNVYLITHNQSVKDLLPNSIRIEKRDGVSAIMA